MGTLRKEQIDEIKGTGRILREGALVVAKAPYSLRVRQDIITSKTFGGRSSDEGNRYTVGRIKLDERTVAPLVGEALVLELEDGRRFPFIFRDRRGAIKALCGFEDLGP